MSKKTNLVLQILFVGILIFAFTTVDEVNKIIQSEFTLYRETNKCHINTERLKDAIRQAKAANNVDDVKALEDWLVKSSTNCDATKASYSEFISAKKDEIFSSFLAFLFLFFPIALIPLSWDFLLNRIAEIGAAFRGKKK
jgi:Ca2+/Na+ antiporter